MDSTTTSDFKARSQKASKYIQLVNFVFSYLLYDFGGGQKKIKVSTVVSTVCLALIPITLYLKFHFAVGTWQSWWTTAIYISYLFVWPSKGHFFPDESWEPKLTNPSVIIFASYNLAELAAGYYFVSGYHPYAYPLPDEQWLALCTVVFILGVLIFTLSDAQKHFILKYQKPRSLFTDGFFRYTRNPNYLGQTMVYTSFGMMAFDWIPLAVYVFVFIFVFITNMLVKEASMSRYPQWAEYKKRTGLLLPKFWS
jgi:protein-S-isoprenylcysteine O-methyltransferase Ste14